MPLSLHFTRKAPHSYNVVFNFKKNSWLTINLFFMKYCVLEFKIFNIGIQYNGILKRPYKYVAIFSLNLLLR